ncbi:conserved protein of unknown function [Burkholderia multivorans]
MKKGMQIKRLLSVCCVAVLSACGGGGGSTQASGNAGGSSQLSGTVAVGAPMLNATVTVLGANGQSVSTAATDSGSYASLDVSALTPPYRIQACGLANGQSTCYYAFVQSGGVANVTPLTDATVALALAGDASTLFNGATPTAAAMASSMQTLQNLLGPVLTAAGMSANSDFTTTPFNANHTGMDKVLDAVKISTGHNNGATFVQLEGVVGSGNAYVDSQGNQSGSLNAGSLINGMAVDLTGISTIFNGLNNGIGSSNAATCASTIGAHVAFDPNFALNIGNQPLTAANAATNLCAYAASNGFLGGKVANPALRSCDFSGSDKICTVGFDVIDGTLSVESAEMAVVLRQGSATWALLGEENPYGINAGAAVQRTLRVGVGGAQPAYSRNLSIDVPTTVGGNATAPHAAKVYAHDAAGNWDLSAPIVTLSDTGCAGQPNLTITGYSCGGEWLSLDRYTTTALANGDALIDAFYRRGRDLRVDLYSDSAATTKYASVVVRIHGVPPKSADLPGVPWLDVDAASQSALAAYDSGTSVSKTLGVSWASNPAVIAHDLTLCADSACGTKVHASLPGSSSQTSATMNLASLNVSAAGYKRLTLYGRDRDEVGYESAYLSCQTGSPGCQ